MAFMMVPAPPFLWRSVGGVHPPKVSRGWCGQGAGSQRAEGKLEPLAAPHSESPKSQVRGEGFQLSRAFGDFM